MLGGIRSHDYAYGRGLVQRPQERRRHISVDDIQPFGEQDSMLIGSLVELAWGEIDSEPIIAKIASEEIKIISLTITEGGYKVDFNQSRSVFWYVAEGLKRRMEKDLPITILSCDNMQMNGNAAKMCVYVIL